MLLAQSDKPQGFGDGVPKILPWAQHCLATPFLGLTCFAGFDNKTSGIISFDACKTIAKLCLTLPPG